MKQSLTKLLVKPVIKDEDEPKLRESEEIDQEYEDLFNNMEEIKDDKNVEKGKRRKAEEVNTPKVKKKKTKKL